MGIVDKVVDKAKVAALHQAYSYLAKDPAKNVFKLLNLSLELVKGDGNENTVIGIQEAFKDPDGMWFKYYLNIWNSIDHGVLKRFYDNLVINATFEGMKIVEARGQELDCNIPWAILLDPTSACNLKCTGCWAAEYDHSLNLDYDTLDSIVRQGKELGTHFYIYSGGEPLIRKTDIIKLCEAHQDCEFLAFTNGTLIDEEFADEMLRVQNFIPAISVEGFEEATDFRRGKGTFQRLRKGMQILKDKKLPFGVSCCYTSANAEVIGSEAYYDAIIKWGAIFAWFFTYIPVGAGAVTDLMVSAEKRKYMYDFVHEMRKKKPIFVIDFWNDGEPMGGCIAAGKKYLHINANGDIEPCAFIHYADHNIHTGTLLEALRGPLFQAYRKGQPFNDNPLRPCPLLDNPDRLSEMVKESGAKSTDMLHPDDVDDLTGRCKPASKDWAPIADELWGYRLTFADCARCRK